MQPKTKLQKRVYELHQKLPPITAVQKKWAQETCLDKHGLVSRNRLFCLECGHKWAPTSKIKVEVPKLKKSVYLIDILAEAEHPQKNGPDWIVKCPSCKNKLLMYRKNQQYIREGSWWGAWTTHEEFQVIRICTVQKYMVKSKPVECWSTEDMQYWIGKDGKITVISRVANHFSYTMSGELSIKPTGQENLTDYNVDPKHVYPKTKILPEIVRNGFDGSLHGVPPHKLFSFILSSQVGETLLKLKHYHLFKHFVEYRHRLNDNIWTALKICFRNKYKIDAKNLIIWMDYINLLIHFEKDIHNAEYVCPKDLKACHDRYVKRKQKIDRREKALKIREECVADQTEYEKEKAKFFDLRFVQGDIVIEPMKSIDQIFEESDRLHHCAFTNKYHKRKESLLMSVRVSDKITETMEISLTTFKVIQSRGLQNQASKYNKQIVALALENMHNIKEAMKPKRKLKSKSNPKQQSEEAAA